MEGRNTFGCLVNGQLWLPEGGLGQSGVLAEVSTANDTVAVIIYADDADGPSSVALQIRDTPTLVAGKNFDLGSSGHYGRYSAWVGGRACSYEQVISGNLQFQKFDLSKRVIAGTFEFTAYSTECNDTIAVTKGRFDVGDISQ